MDEAVYDQVATATAAVYADHSDTCMPDNCPRAEFIGCVVRFPGHDLLGSATDGFGGQFGGADGCWESSRGLFDCTSGNTLSLLEVYRDVCSQVSLGDFAVIAAEALMAHTATDRQSTAAAFKQNFMYGRSSREGCKHVSLMELPSSQAGCKTLARGFIDRIYSGYNYPMTSVRSSVCTGTRCAAAPFASGNSAAYEYANMSKAWYLTPPSRARARWRPRSHPRPPGRAACGLTTAT